MFLLLLCTYSHSSQFEFCESKWAGEQASERVSQSASQPTSVRESLYSYVDDFLFRAILEFIYHEYLGVGFNFLLATSLGSSDIASSMSCFRLVLNLISFHRSNKIINNRVKIMALGFVPHSECVKFFGSYTIDECSLMLIQFVSFSRPSPRAQTQARTGWSCDVAFVRFSNQHIG